ncbi:MAG: SLBB domain-containing protein [Candidatus Manganitrophus sp.]|nr:SLBB domain-containing protein [Candidatus Manganitrophus sp.]
MGVHGRRPFVLSKAIAEAYRHRYLGKNILETGYNLEMILHVSAGRYICGEETALLNALEGKRANPRAKPPYPQTVGLWGKPTVVNNVETFCNVPHIVKHGADWFQSLSRTKDAGTKLYGASGKVKRPGVWELPMGTTAREILEEHAGGMRDGLRFRGAIPGGASTDFLTEAHLDMPMDFDEIKKAGSRLGTATLIVLDDRTCPVGMLWNLEQFFAQESCGWCTPCCERPLLGGADPAGDGAGGGRRGRSGDSARADEVHGPRQYLLRPRARRDGAAGERAELFSRRFRAAPPGETLPVEKLR